MPTAHDATLVTTPQNHSRKERTSLGSKAKAHLRSRAKAIVRGVDDMHPARCFDLGHACNVYLSFGSDSCSRDPAGGRGVGDFLCAGPWIWRRRRSYLQSTARHSSCCWRQEERGRRAVCPQFPVPQQLCRHAATPGKSNHLHRHNSRARFRPVQ